MRGLESESKRVKAEHDAMAGRTAALKARIKELEDDKKGTAIRTRVFTERFYATHQALESATARIAVLTSTFDAEVARARQTIAGDLCLCNNVVVTGHVMSTWPIETRGGAVCDGTDDSLDVFVFLTSRESGFRIVMCLCLGLQLCQC